MKNISSCQKSASHLTGKHEQQLGQEQDTQSHFLAHLFLKACFSFKVLVQLDRESN